KCFGQLQVWPRRFRGGQRPSILYTCPISWIGLLPGTSAPRSISPGGHCVPAVLRSFANSTRVWTSKFLVSDLIGTGKPHRHCTIGTGVSFTANSIWVKRDEGLPAF